MVDDLITEHRYNSLLKNEHWKKSMNEYREEKELSDEIYMEEDLFEKLNQTLDARSYTHQYLRNLGAHGSMSGPSFFKHDSDRRMFFRTRDSLTELGIIQLRTSKLSAEGRAYVMEWGRRTYE